MANKVNMKFIKGVHAIMREAGLVKYGAGGSPEANTYTSYLSIDRDMLNIEVTYLRYSSIKRRYDEMERILAVFEAHDIDCDATGNYLHIPIPKRVV